ncbi:MAG: hypothetical protein ACTSWJ_02345 [Candidatus Heimdallarchaeaceae archaeon]
MIINRDMFERHLDHATYHVRRAEMWLDRDGSMRNQFTEHNIELAKSQIIMAKLYVGWHPKLAENYDT